MFLTRSRFLHVLRQPISRNHSSTSTLSEDELKKFSKMANEWWDINGPFNGLHSMNKLRVPFIRDGIHTYQRQLVENATPTAPLAGCKILDIGCGGGILSESLAKLGATVTAIDPSEESIMTATLHAQNMGIDNLTYKVSTVENFKASTMENPVLFDAITASEVIEHVENPNYFIETCNDLLKPGGSLFITTINRTIASFALAVCAAEYLLRLLPVGTHNWNKFITPEEMMTFMRKNNLQLRQLHGMCYNPFANNWSWTKDTNISYAIHAVSKRDIEAAAQVDVEN